MAALTATPAEGVAGEPVAFSGAGSTPGQTILNMFMPSPADPSLFVCMPLGGSVPVPVAKWTWSFGDGTAALAEADALVDHVFAAAGTYTVELEVLAGTLTHKSTLPVVVKAKPVAPTPPVVTPPATTTPPVTAPATPPVAPAATVVPPVATTKTLKSNAVYCAAASKKRAKGSRGTPFSRCVSALAKLRAKTATTAAQACRGASKKVSKGSSRSPFRQCTTAAAVLLRDLSVAPPSRPQA